MPSYNQACFIEDAIQSVLRNQSENLRVQLIIQDNLSDDGTESILAKFAHLNEVEVYREVDSGQADAIAKGFKKAKAPIISWLNSDDVLLPGALSEVMSNFMSNNNIDIVYGEALFIDRYSKLRSIYPTHEFNKELLLSTCYLSQPSVFFKRSFYESISGIDTKLNFCLDYDLWIRFVFNGAKFLYVDQFLSATRIYEETKTSTGGSKFVDEILAMLEKNLGHTPDTWKVYKRYSNIKGYNPSFVQKLMSLSLALYQSYKIEDISILKILKTLLLGARIRIRNKLRLPKIKHLI